jgi:gas vesicle protein
LPKPLTIAVTTLVVGLGAAAALAAIAKAGGWSPDLANTAWGMIAGGISGAVITGVVGVLIRGSIDEQLAERQAKLSRENGEALEKVRASLLADLAEKKGQVDREVQKAVEQERGSITRDVERLKHELAREVEKSKLQTARLHQVLPELWAKVLKAKAPLAQWYGFWQHPSWSGLNVAEVDSNLRRQFAFISDAEVTAFIAAFVAAEPRERDKVVRDRLEPLLRVYAERLAGDAHTFQQLNVLFLPADVLGAAEKAILAIRQAVACAEYRGNHEMERKGMAHDLAADKHVAQLQVAMRRALAADLEGATEPVVAQCPDS